MSLAWYTRGYHVDDDVEAGMAPNGFKARANVGHWISEDRTAGIASGVLLHGNDRRLGQGGAAVLAGEACRRRDRLKGFDKAK